MDPDFMPPDSPLPPPGLPLSPVVRQVLSFGWRLPWISQPLALLEALFVFCVDTLAVARCHLQFEKEEGRGAFVRHHPETSALAACLADSPGGLEDWLQLVGGKPLDFSAEPFPAAPAGIHPAAPDAARVLAGLCLPLVVEARVAGVLVISGRAFTPEEKVWLEFLARQAGEALGRLRLRADLEFLGHISRGLAHDLQGALTPVGTYLQLSALDGAGTHKLAALLPTAMVGYDKVQAILRQAIALSRGDPLAFTTVSLATITREAFAALQAQATAARVEFILDCPDTVQARTEPVLLLRLLLNLLSNALAASPPDCQVHVEITTGPDGPGIIRVIDRGAGISAADLQRAGDLELREQTGGPGGQVPGLGIATSRRIARRLHGRLDFDGRNGRGTTVTIALPLA